MSSHEIGGCSEKAIFYRLPKDQEGGIAVELPSVAALVLLDSMPFTANEKLVHKVYKRDSNVPRQDLTHLQGQWTRQVL